MSGLLLRPASPHVRHRVEGPTEQVADSGTRHGAGEERADVERAPDRPHVVARDTGSDKSLAEVDQIGPAERLGQCGIRAAVCPGVVVLRHDHGELVGPGVASGSLEPGVLSADRRRQVVQPDERGEVPDPSGVAGGGVSPDVESPGYAGGSLVVMPRP